MVRRVRSTCSTRSPRAVSSTTINLLSAVRARLLQDLGRRDEAREAYCRALAGARLEPEQRLLQRRLAALDENLIAFPLPRLG